MGRLLKASTRNKKTTLAGVLTAVIAVANAGVALVNGENPDWTTTIAAVTAAIGLLFAKDGDK